MIDPSLYRNTDAWTLENHTKYINHTYLMHFWPNPGLKTVVSLILKCYILNLAFHNLVKRATIWVRMQQFLAPKPDQKKIFRPHPSLLTLFQFEILPFPDLISVSRFFTYRTYKRTFLRSKTVRYTVVFTHFDFFIRNSNGDEKVE